MRGVSPSVASTSPKRASGAEHPQAGALGATGFPDGATNTVLDLEVATASWDHLPATLTRRPMPDVDRSLKGSAYPNARRGWAHYESTDPDG